jgi:hypothetical protein
MWFLVLIFLILAIPISIEAPEVAKLDVAEKHIIFSLSHISI